MFKELYVKYIYDYEIVWKVCLKKYLFVFDKNLGIIYGEYESCVNVKKRY